MSKFNRKQFINNLIRELRRDLNNAVKRDDLRYLVNHHNSLVSVDDFIFANDIKDVNEEIEWCCREQRNFCSTMSNEELEECYGQKKPMLDEALYKN